MKTVYIIATAVLCGIFAGADCRATVYFKFLSFSNRDSTLLSGEKCDKSTSKKLCDYLFEVRIGDNAKFGSYQTLNPMSDHPTATDITLDKFNSYLPQPLIFNIGDEAVPAQLTLSLKVLDENQNTPDLVYILTTKVGVRTSLHGKRDWMKSSRTEGKKRIEFELAVACKLNYYSDTCLTFCEPQDSDANGHYNCSESGQKVCHAGYTGSDCNSRDACASADVCNSRGTCTVSGNSFVCECSERYEGARCESEKSACSGHVCENGASCELINGEATCQCPALWTGLRCELAREAQCTAEEERQCNNGAPCMKTYNDSLTVYNTPRCICTPDYLPPDCSTRHPCWLNDTCSFRGRCVAVGVEFVCNCDDGFGGSRCEQSLDPCDPNPCCNNATCRPQAGQATCICPQFYSGQLCRTYNDPCLNTSCYNGGVCYVARDTVACRCPEEFEGPLCETPRDPCLRSATLCRNGATCYGNARNSTYTCLCAPRFSGPRCETYNDPCANKPCNNGLCIATRDSFQCTCGVEFTGADCSVVRNPCEYKNLTCLNRGTCYGDFATRNAVCQCAPNYSGTRCEFFTNPCEPNPCRLGRCNIALHGYSCACDAEHEGVDCSTPRNPCIRSNPCLNNATCVGNSTRKSFSCLCAPYFSGSRCETYNDPCANNPCNSGLCIATRDSFQCSCGIEFTGADCSVVRNPCEYKNLTCLNRGTCYGDFATRNAVCQCAPNYSGTRCEFFTNPCEPNPCRLGRCNIALHGYSCVCDAEHDGVDCSTPRNPCLRSNPCLNNATCVGNATRKSYSCLCKPNFSGLQCATYVDPCLRNPCKYGRCSVNRDGFECFCQQDYEGLDCSIPRNPCVRNSTLCNSGRCTASISQGTYSCSCPVNYRGRHCEEHVNKATSPLARATSNIKTITTVKPGVTAISNVKYVTGRPQNSKNSVDSNKISDEFDTTSNTDGLSDEPAAHDAHADGLNMFTPNGKFGISKTMRYLILCLSAAVVLLIATVVAICIKSMQRKVPVPKTRRRPGRAATARVIDFSSTYSYSVPLDPKADEKRRQLSMNADGPGSDAPTDQRYSSMFRPRTASFALANSTLGRLQSDALLSARLLSGGESSTSFVQNRDSCLPSPRSATLSRVQPIVEHDEYSNLSQFATVRKFSFSQVPPTECNDDDQDDLYANVGSNSAERSNPAFEPIVECHKDNDFPLPPDTIAEVNDCDSFSTFSGIDGDDVYENH